MITFRNEGWRVLAYEGGHAVAELRFDGANALVWTTPAGDRLAAQYVGRLDAAWQKFKIRG